MVKHCLCAAMVFVALPAVGCGGHGEYHRTGRVYAARGPDCDYRVLRNRVVEPYEELGVVDIDAFSVKQLPRNETEFRRVVGQTVCSVGGEAVIPALNIYGRWVQGTVIRFNPAECPRCKNEAAKEDEG